MPSERLFGAVLVRAAGPRYWESLRFAEVAPRDPLPRPSTLGKWRRSAPEQARVTLLAPAGAWKAALGPSTDRAATEAARWIRQAAAAIAADAVVLATGKDLSPGPRDRERLARLVERLAGRGGCRVVWVPGGLWDREDAAQAAAAIGAICGFDPLEDAAPAGELAYGRVRAIGARARLGEGLLRSIADVVASATAGATWIAFESADGMRKARRATEMLAAIGKSGGAPARGETTSDRAHDLDLDAGDQEKHLHADDNDEDLDEHNDDEDLDEHDDDEDHGDDNDDEDDGDDNDEDDKDLDGEAR
jgi:hypothetical protein